MPTVTLDSFLPEVRPEVPDCPYPMMINAIRNAAREFCADSKIWKEDISSITLVAGTKTYTLAPPTDTIVQMLYPRYNGVDIPMLVETTLNRLYYGWSNETGQDCRALIMLDPRTVRPYPIPDSNMTITTVDLKAALKPTSTATTIDQYVYEDWHEGISAGAVARLMKMPNKPWTNDRARKDYGGLYLDQKARATVRASKNFGNTPESAFPNSANFWGV